MATLPAETQASPPTLWSALTNAEPHIANLIQDVGTFPGFSHIVTADERHTLAHIGDTIRRRLTPAQPDEIERFVTKLSVAFPSQRLTDDEAQLRLDQYRDALADLPRDVLGHAYLAVIRSHRFFPTVAEIRAHCGEALIRRWQLSRIDALTRAHDRTQIGRPIDDPDEGKTGRHEPPEMLHGRK